MLGGKGLSLGILSAVLWSGALPARGQEDGRPRRREPVAPARVWSQWNQPPGSVYNPNWVNRPPQPAPHVPPQPAATPVIAQPHTPAPRPETGTEPSAAPAPQAGDDFIYRGPRRPPEFVDFSDEFAEIVTKYVHAQARRNNGAFVIKDDKDGAYHYLRLSRIYPDRITRVSPTEVFGCVEFTGIRGSRGAYDLDFYLTNADWSWKVSKLLIHEVDGQARFHYTREHVAVALAAPSGPGPAAAPAPSAPARLKASAAFHWAAGAAAGELRPGEPAQLLVTVANAGPGPAYAVRLVPSLLGDVPGLGLPGEVALGDIPAGASTSAAVALAGSWELRTQKARLKVSVQEANGFDADPLGV
ncbi:MAG: hypothetical protein PHU21_06195, partial [Elusimicrobia bacterium]|nr:hypothetical protein [Elusimicrobiota bacterium]